MKDSEQFSLQAMHVCMAMHINDHGFTAPACSLCLLAAIRQLMYKVAAADPLVYFSVSEMLCRQQQHHLLHTMALGNRLLLGIPGLLSGAAHQQLLPSWNHYRAYASALASWSKAYVKGLPAAAAAARSGNAEVAEGLLLLTQELCLVVCWLQSESPTSRPVAAGMVGMAAGLGLHWWQSDPPGTHAETLSSFRLVLLLLLT